MSRHPCDLAVHPPHPRLAARHERLVRAKHHSSCQELPLQLDESADDRGQPLRVLHLRHEARLVPLVLAGLHEVLDDARTRAQTLREAGGGIRRKVCGGQGAPDAARSEPGERLVPSGEFMGAPVRGGVGEQGAAAGRQGALEVRVTDGRHHPAPVPVRPRVPRHPADGGPGIAGEQSVMIDQDGPGAGAPRRGLLLGEHGIRTRRAQRVAAEQEAGRGHADVDLRAVVRSVQGPVTVSPAPAVITAWTARPPGRPGRATPATGPPCARP